MILRNTMYSGTITDAFRKGEPVVVKPGDQWRINEKNLQKVKVANNINP